MAIQTKLTVQLRPVPQSHQFFGQIGLDAGTPCIHQDEIYHLRYSVISPAQIILNAFIGLQFEVKDVHVTSNNNSSRSSRQEFGRVEIWAVGIQAGLN